MLWLIKRIVYKRRAMLSDEIAWTLKTHFIKESWEGSIKENKNTIWKIWTRIILSFKNPMKTM